MAELWTTRSPGKPVTTEITVTTPEGATDGERLADAAGDMEQAGASPEEAFAGFTQSADGQAIAYENPAGNSRSYMEQDVAELEAAADFPIDESLGEPESAEAQETTEEAHKSPQELAEEDALRHAREIAEEDHRMQMAARFGGQWEQQINAGFEQRVDSLRNSVSDFQQTMRANNELINALEARPDLSDAIKALPYGADVAYYLCKNPTKARLVFGMNDQDAVQAIIEFQRDARLDSPQRAVRRSAAPPPINPVRGSATQSSVPLDQVPYQDYKRIREQQRKGRINR